MLPNFELLLMLLIRFNKNGNWYSATELHYDETFNGMDIYILFDSLSELERNKLIQPNDIELSFNIDTKFRITPLGREMTDENKLQQFYRDKDEKENLELQKIRTEVVLLTNQLADYENYKRIAKYSLIVSILSLLLSTILGVMMLR